MNETVSPPTGESATTVRVELGPRSYDILIGRGLIDRAGSEIARRLPDRRVAIITDTTVADFHLRTLQQSLTGADIDHMAVTVEPGEGSKSFATLETVVDTILAARIERGDIILALGGGVVGDLAGFAAGIIRRGMRFVQVPTTLLAQVDSSVGGKTGINTARGKNLVGLFLQPQFVLADAGILDSLPTRDFNAGYAEVVKYGLIGDADFFAWLEDNWRSIAAAVAEDERDEGARALLNLGHTFGHALEAATGYDGSRLVHGEAVAVGMVLAHRMSARMNLAPPEDTERVIAHLKDVGLPTEIADIPGDKPSAETLMGHIGQDKKVTRGSLNFILTRGIGQAFIARDVSPQAVSDFLESQLTT